MSETKRQRFIRIAEARTNKILNMVQLLGNCSNKSAYEYTDEDVKKIFSAIESEVRTAKTKFSEKGSSDSASRFHLQ